ncbi:hypothetical protein, partial, partial [Absidia glauca]
MNEQQNELQMLPGMEFDDIEAAKSHQRAYSRQENIDVVIARSDYKIGSMTWRCKHGGSYRSAKGDDVVLGGGKTSLDQSIHEKLGLDVEDANNNNISATRQKVEMKTYRSNCPFKVTLYLNKANSKTGKKEHWSISKVINEHNHPIAQSRLTYARNRRPTEEEMKSVTRLL